MNPYVQQQLIEFRTADLHRQAEAYRMTREARRARRADQQPSARHLHRHGTVLQHLLQAVLSRYAQSLRPASAAPQLPAGSRR